MGSFFEERLTRGVFFLCQDGGWSFAIVGFCFGASYQNNVSHVDQTIHQSSEYRASKSIPFQMGDVAHPRRCLCRSVGSRRASQLYVVGILDFTGEGGGRVEGGRVGRWEVWLSEGS